MRDCPEFDDWQAATADRLRQRLAGILERLVTLCAQAGELDQALDHARRWLALDQLHEPAHQALIRLLAWTGQRSAALRQYRALVRILDRELAVRPLPETTRLYDDARAGRLGSGITRPGPGGAEVAGGVPRPSGAPGAPVGRPPGRAPDWPLVGREDELYRLHAAWRAVGAAGQVATVLGAAGCGKTRLVAEFRAGAARAGATVLAGRGHDGESELPFALAADLLRTALSACPELPARLPAHTAAMAGSARNWPPTTPTTWPRWTARWR